jgi:hypothetical protein
VIVLVLAYAGIAESAVGRGRVTLACSGIGTIKHLVAPRNCLIYYPNRVRNNAVEMQRLHWSGWGTDHATATGITHYAHDNGPSDPIRVVASRLRHVRCSGQTGSWYTRLAVTTPYGTSHLHTDYC